MSHDKDPKAVHGYQPNWDLQQRKQELIARERDERMDKKLAEKGKV